MVLQFDASPRAGGRLNLMRYINAKHQPELVGEVYEAIPQTRWDGWASEKKEHAQTPNQSRKHALPLSLDTLKTTGNEGKRQTNKMRIPRDLLLMRWADTLVL